MQLQQVVTFIRHGDRTSTNSRVAQKGTGWPPKQGCWPNDSGQWQCSARDVVTVQADQWSTFNWSMPQFLTRKQYDDGENTVAGTCFQGQLTDRGYKQQLNNGRMFREAYVQRTPLLSPLFNADTAQHELYIRSDDYPRTIQSAEGLLMGLYPAGSIEKRNVMMQLVVMHLREVTTDPLAISTTLCPRIQTYSTAAVAQQSFLNYSSSLKPLAEKLSKVSEERNAKVNTN
jgi:hypothetical protein